MGQAVKSMDNSEKVLKDIMGFTQKELKTLDAIKKDSGREAELFGEGIDYVSRLVIDVDKLQAQLQEAVQLAVFSPDDPVLRKAVILMIRLHKDVSFLSGVVDKLLDLDHDDSRRIAKLEKLFYEISGREKTALKKWKPLYESLRNEFSDNRLDKNASERSKQILESIDEVLGGVDAELKGLESDYRRVFRISKGMKSVLLTLKDVLDNSKNSMVTYLGNLKHALSKGGVDISSILAVISDDINALSERLENVYYKLSKMRKYEKDVFALIIKIDKGNSARIKDIHKAISMADMIKEYSKRLKL